MERVLDIESNVCQRDKIRTEGMAEFPCDKKLAEYKLMFCNKGAYWIMLLEPNQGQVAPIYCSRYHTQMDNPWETTEGAWTFYSEYPALFLLVGKDDTLVEARQIKNGDDVFVWAAPITTTIVVHFGEKPTPLVIEPDVKIEALAEFMGRRAPHSKHIKCAVLCPVNSASKDANWLEACRGIAQCHINMHIEALRQLSEDTPEYQYKQDTVGGEYAKAEGQRQGTAGAEQEAAGQ